MTDLPVICRIWHGWTTVANADIYERLLKEEILPGIHRVKGYKGSQLLRCKNSNEEVKFITHTYFDGIEAVIEFAGKDFTKAVVPEAAQRLLLRFDEHSIHYELKFDDVLLWK